MDEPKKRPQWAIDKQIDVGDTIRVGHTHAGVYTFTVEAFEQHGGAAVGSGRRYCPIAHGPNVSLVSKAPAPIPTDPRGPWAREHDVKIGDVLRIDYSFQKGVILVVESFERHAEGVEAIDGAARDAPSRKWRYVPAVHGLDVATVVHRAAPAPSSPNDRTVAEVRAALGTVRSVSVVEHARVLRAENDKLRAELTEIRAALQPETGESLAVAAKRVALRLHESQALVARARTAIGAASMESTDDALARIRRDAHAEPGESARDAIKRHTGAALTLRACLDVVERVVGFRANEKPDVIRAAFETFEMEIERAIAPMKIRRDETTAEALERFRAETSKTIRAASDALGCAPTDLVAACARAKCLADRYENAGVEGDLQRIRRALGVPDGKPLLDGAREAGDALARIRDAWGVNSSSPKTIAIVVAEARQSVHQIATDLGLPPVATFREILARIGENEARAVRRIGYTAQIRVALGYSSIGIDDEADHAKTLEIIRELRRSEPESPPLTLTIPPSTREVRVTVRGLKNGGSISTDRA